MFFLGPSPYRKVDLYEANFRTRALRRYFSVPVPVLHKKKYLKVQFSTILDITAYLVPKT